MVAIPKRTIPFLVSDGSVPPDTTLFEFIRYHANLLGTKAMCQEGGCGACVVSATRHLPPDNQPTTIAVNSCLVYVHSCHQWEITTIEGIGNKQDGYHPIQKKLAAYNGTQCGYCSPGWVMSMYSLTEGGSKKLSSAEIERSFASNMCRCTAYRPILDAFKSFASDAVPTSIDDLLDLEDMHIMKCTKKCNRKCSLEDDEWCVVDGVLECAGRGACTVTAPSGHSVEPAPPGQGEVWIKASSIDDVFRGLRTYGSTDYRLICGNTGRGVYPSTSDAKVLIDIASVVALRQCVVDTNLILGAALTLNETMAAFSRYAAQNDEFRYLDVLHKHLDLVAHIPVRNVGTVGGNLGIKNLHNDFASDVFLILETVGAIVTLIDSHQTQKYYELTKFLTMNLRNQLILNVKLPPLSAQYLLQTYKIMPRAQNAHATMNAGFLFKVNRDNVIEYCRIVYGAVARDFVHASKTENILKKRPLFDENTLKAALEELNEEIVPVREYSEATPYAKKMIALGLFYKALLSLAPSEAVSARFRSGGALFERGVSRGQQTFDTDKSLWPLNQPIPKLEGLAQTSGEAIYSDDVESNSREVHVAFILSTICKGEIDTIDATEVLKWPGVFAVYTAKDIPGMNNFTPSGIWNTGFGYLESDEELFCSGTVLYNGQVLGMVAAKTRKLALRAAKHVTVHYKNMSKEAPVLSVDDALKARDASDRMRQEYSLTATDRGTDTRKIIKGRFNAPAQYHYTLEPQTCRAQVSEFGVEVHSATQWVDHVTVAVAQVLAVQENQVNITVSRVGGAYGGKVSRPAQSACACALAAYRLRRPARLVMSVTDMMDSIGKRPDTLFEYEVGVNDAGVIQHAEIKYYSDQGVNYNDTPAAAVSLAMVATYTTTRFNVTGYSVLTDKPCSTWCRAPASTEGAAAMEYIMEHIAHVTNLDPIAVRNANLLSTHETFKGLISSFQEECLYSQRKAAIEKFNKGNAWVKKSIKVVPMVFPIAHIGSLGATVNIYHGDGTIAVSHGGIEIGQGINTKVAQVCAYTLGVPLDKVTIKPSTNFTSPNNIATMASFTSESVAFAVVQACTELTQRLQAVKETLTDPTWEELVQAAFIASVNLQASYTYSQNDGLGQYIIYGVSIAEVLVDVLSGTHQLLRVDVLEDTGQSLSPVIDVGQVEGAFLMGVGMWTSESLQYEPSTGRLATNRTWTYKPPGARDIPLDFRVSFRRNEYNTIGVLGSKATGEPPLLMSVVVLFAIHDAIVQARTEFGYDDSDWLPIATPYSIQNIVESMQPKIESYKLK